MHGARKEMMVMTMTDLISREDAIEAVASADETNGTVKVFSGLEIIDILKALPSAEAVQGGNNHEIACMLADLFKDPCACNQCCIDEWLPYKCDLDCGNVVGVACWEQFVKHYRGHKGGGSE